MKYLLLVFAASAVPAWAQTPLCAWNGSGLAFPGQPSPSLATPLPNSFVLNPLPTPQQRVEEQIEQQRAQGDLDRALAVAEAERAVQRREAARQAEANAAARYCSGAETLADKSPELVLDLLSPRCVAPHR